MTFAKNLIKISWLYQVNNTEEIAETGLHVSTLGTSPFDATAWLAALTTTQATTLETAIQDILSATDIKWADYSKQIGMKVAALGTDGAYLAAPRLFTDYNNNGNDSGVIPQSTVVLSFRSGTTFGEGNYGRMYLPHTGMSLDTNLPVTTVAHALQVSLLGANFVTAVNGVAAAVQAGSGVVIASAKGSGVNKGVARVGVGTIIDTQRRRYNRIDPNYQYTTV